MNIEYRKENKRVPWIVVIADKVSFAYPTYAQAYEKSISKEFQDLEDKLNEQSGTG